METGLVYGVLTAGTAISSGFAGARAARLSKKASQEGFTAKNLLTALGGAEIARMQEIVTDAMSERCAGAQNAAAWLATATALFGVASTRPFQDTIGISFLLIGAGLVAVAIQAMLKATEATALPPALTSFEQWYVPWIQARTLESAKPTDEEVAFTFAAQNKTPAATLQRFGVWPFHYPDQKEAIHLSRSGHLH